MEWLYHLGVPTDQIEELAEHSVNTVPCMMPYITAFFIPRHVNDRPKVVVDGAVNFAFIGQFLAKRLGIRSSLQNIPCVPVWKLSIPC